jgi:hypothetical protein
MGSSRFALGWSPHRSEARTSRRAHCKLLTVPGHMTKYGQSFRWGQGSGAPGSYLLTEDQIVAFDASAGVNRSW